MKLLHINEYYSAEGGLELYLLRLCRELEARGHENVIVYGNQGAGRIEHGRKNLYLPQITAVNCPQNDHMIEQLGRLIALEKPRLIFIHQVLNPRLIDFLVKAHPHIRFAHGHKLTCPTGRRMLKRGNRICLHRISRFCQLRAYRYRCMPRNLGLGLSLLKACRKIVTLHKRYSQLIVASKFMRRVLVLNGFSPEKITIIPYFVEIPQLSGKIQEPLNLHILCVSRLTPEKGLSYLLKAFQLVKSSAKLIIAGDGPYLGELRQQVKDLGLADRVSFSGWLNDQGLSRLYQQATVVVIPSMWPEPFGIVGIEAMAHGKPVVAFDVGGIAEWLADSKTGYLVKRGDVADLAGKINYLLDHKTESAQMGHLARQVAEQEFSVATHIEKLMAVVENTGGIQS